MSKKYSKSPYATFNGKPVLYVTFKATGIHPLIPFIDGLPMVVDKANTKRAETFMAVTDVIAWHETELRESNGQSGDARVLELLKIALDKFEKEHPPSPKEQD